MGTVFAGGDAIAVWPLYSIFSKRERERENSELVRKQREDGEFALDYIALKQDYI